MSHSKKRRQCNCISRRSFLRGAAGIAITPILGLGGLSGRRAYAAGAGNPGKFVVVINMLGGNDGLNTVIPTHLPAYSTRRPALALQPVADGLHALTGGWYLHGNLPTAKSLWDAGELHIVQKVGYPDENLSHFTSQDIYSFGVRDLQANGDGRGWLGRFADAYCSTPSEPLGVIAVGVGRRPDFEAQTTPPLILKDVAGFNVLSDPLYEADHSLRVGTIRSVLGAETPPIIEPDLTIFSSIEQAHNLVDRVQQETAGWVNPGTYPGTAIGGYLRTISQLLHAQDSFGTRIFYTGFGGFDTHATQEGSHATLLGQLDAALSAFSQDMRNKGKWEDCAVIVISEFGRRNAENGSAGTDHGHGNCFLVCGGAVDGGSMTGDVANTEIADRLQLGYTYDFRELYSNLVSAHIGVSAAPLFPETFVSTGDIQLI
ncbi:MAG: DUF1501 domain-containing protein [Planctomycetes bacterium]|nr:DUF1501 domain-containing protein [Planctomycetota bacterium]